MTDFSALMDMTRVERLPDHTLVALLREADADPDTGPNLIAADNLAEELVRRWPRLEDALAEWSEERDFESTATEVVLQAIDAYPPVDQLPAAELVVMAHDEAVRLAERHEGHGAAKTASRVMRPTLWALTGDAGIVFREAFRRSFEEQSATASR